MIRTNRFRCALLVLIIAISAFLLVTRPGAFTQHVSAQSPFASIIVELKRDPVVVAKTKAQAAGQSFNPNSYRQQVIADQQQFLQRLTLAGVPYRVSSVNAPNGPGLTPTLEFRFSYVYNGITLEVPAHTLPIISGLTDVLAVHRNDPVRLTLDHAVDYTRAPLVYGNPARLTGFDTLNTGGLEGDGVVIAVIDTGVDWSHEMFGGDPTLPQLGAAPAVAALGTHKKVIYFMNFTAGAWAYDDFGHGTHVAADAAGYRGYAPGPDGVPFTADDVAVHGVAPQAKIMSYKVITGANAGVSSSIIAAIEDAVQPRTITGQPKPVAHIINLSLGTQEPADPDHPTSVACDNATLAGAIVVASAGNSGPGDQTAGIGTIGSPGSARHAITVAASNDPGPILPDRSNDVLFDNGAPLDLIDVLTTGGRTGVPIKLAGGSQDITAPMTERFVYCGTVLTPDDVPDSVAGHIGIARVSGLYGGVSNALAAKGAIGALLITDDLSGVTTVNSLAPTWQIQECDARYLLNLVSPTAGVDPPAGAQSVFSIRVSLGVFRPITAGFSSRGPVIGFGQVKPDVTAPGVAIMSATSPAGEMGRPIRYTSASGTSFSGPITAGIAALVKQKHPDWNAPMVRAALVNTTTNLRDQNGNQTPDNQQSYAVCDGLQNAINEQGSGLVDAVAAVNTKAMMGVRQPATTGQPQGRTFGITCIVDETGPGCLSPGNPDFTPSYSFGAVPIANVIGTATLSQTVTIFDVGSGSGAGTYQLLVKPVRSVDQSGFRVSFTDAGGNALTSVNVPTGGSASFNVKTEVDGLTVTANPTQAEWYVIASQTIGGQRLRMPFYYRAVQPNLAPTAPSLAAATGSEVSGAPPIDIDGSYSIPYSFSGSPAPAKFRIEEQKDGGPFAILADAPASQPSLAIAGRGNGLYIYRVAGLFAVQYGFLKGPYSETQTVQVDRRIESDITSIIQAAVSSVSFAATVFEFDQTLKNTTTGTSILSPVRFSITAIQSATGTVRASNADNGGNGASSAALFDYSNTLGGDRALTPGEISSSRHLKFSDSAGELFTFTAVIKGNFPDPGFAATSAHDARSARKLKLRLRFIADPATRSIVLISQ